MGVVAETVNSSNPDDWERIEQSVEDDLVDILLVSPERFANDRFRSGLLARLAERISLMALESPAPLVREGGRWQLTATTLDRAFWQRTERLGSLRRVSRWWDRATRAMRCCDTRRTTRLLPPAPG